jgi:phosphopantetheinyl transferase
VPLFFQQDINHHTKLAVWKIEEDDAFFLERVSLSIPVRHPQKRLQHLAGRYLLQHLFPSFPYSLIKIAGTRKPFLPNHEYHFSISHCKNYAAAIVSTNERVGIDVELVSEKVEKIKHKFLHADELRFVNTLSKLQQAQVLTILWSAKEAMFKWYGLGEVDFREMLRTFPFQLQKDEVIDAAFIKDSTQQKLEMRFKLFDDLNVVWVHT